MASDQALRSTTSQILLSSPKTYWGSQVQQTTRSNSFSRFSKGFRQPLSWKNAANPQGVWYTWRTCERSCKDVCMRTLRHVSCRQMEKQTVSNHSGGIAGRHSCPTPSLTMRWSRQTLKAHGNPAGFTVEPRKSKRHPPITVSDLDLGHIDEAQSLLLLVENSVANVGLRRNAVKTQSIVYNQDPAVIETKSNDSMQ